MSLIVADAVDYKGFPADKSRTGGWIPAALSLGRARMQFFFFFATNLCFFLSYASHAVIYLLELYQDCKSYMVTYMVMT